jgi:hypothetical protein
MALNCEPEGMRGSGRGLFQTAIPPNVMSQTTMEPSVITDVDPALGYLHLGEVSSVADVSEVHGPPIVKVDLESEG